LSPAAGVRLAGVGLVLGILAGCSQPSLGAGTDVSGNLLQNPGFEDANGNRATGWTPEARAANKGTIALVSSPVHEGSRALKLAPNQNNNVKGIAGAPLGIGQAFPADRFRGRTLYVTGWLGAEGGATAVTGLYALKKNGAVEFVELRQPASDGKLHHLSDALNVSDDRNIAYIILNCHAEGTSGAAYFDGLYLGTSPPETTVPPPEAAASPLSAEVTIDAGRDLRTIPATLYGTNLEWIRNGNSLVDAKTGAFNDQLVSLTKDLGVTLLRFPGGIFCDFYHWKNGIGPLASRPVLPNMPGTNEKSANVFGTDEALELSRRLNAPLLITANIVTGTPAEAVEWLQYVHARTGPGKAPPVTYWELGNEQYIKGDEPYLKAATMTPDEYARRFIDFAKALKAADPSVKVGAISDETYSGSAKSPYPRWTEQVLAKTADLVDFVSVHNAYVPVLLDPHGLSVRDIYAGMLAAPELVAQSFERLSKTIARYDPNGRIKIAVTEWGPMFHLFPSSPFVDHVKTLGSALYAASVFQTFLRTGRVEEASFFKLSDLLFMGWIGNRQGNWIPNAPYYAFELYSRHFGNVLLSSSSQSPTFSTRTVGLVNAVPDAPYLAAIASRSSDRKKLYLVAVNRSFDRDVAISVEIKNARPESRGVAWLLSGTGIDANTGTELAMPEKWARQATDELNPRFYKGGPGEITFQHENVTGIGPRFPYTVPKHSAVSLEVTLE
jgi:alpha-L-arabinofuranosidase